MSQAWQEMVRRGAYNAVANYMGVRETDRVFVITDEATLSVGQMLANAYT